MWKELSPSRVDSVHINNLTAPDRWSQTLYATSVSKPPGSVLVLSSLDHSRAVACELYNNSDRGRALACQAFATGVIASYTTAVRLRRSLLCHRLPHCTLRYLFWHTQMPRIGSRHIANWVYGIPPQTGFRLPLLLLRTHIISFAGRKSCVVAYYICPSC